MGLREYQRRGSGRGRALPVGEIAAEFTEADRLRFLDQSGIGVEESGRIGDRHPFEDQ